MKIWIMRHGEAGFNAPKDSERRLTEHGKQAAFQQGKTLGQRFKAENCLLDKILVSPYFRTQETLQAFQDGLQAVDFSQNLTNVIETWEGITPSGSPEQVGDYLDFLREEGAKNILIISHLPLVFDLVQYFTQHQKSVHFYPAVVAEIEWNGTKGSLQAVENP